MKNSIFLTIVLFFCISLYAQSQFLVHSDGQGLYLSHHVVAKENFYSIGRIYNVAPKEIATANSIDMNHGLEVGQVLRIPLTTSNFSQSVSEGVPVYYEVGAKEGLYRVSVKNNNVLMANLRKWNRLSSDNIQTGQKLIVGYITGSTTSTTPAIASQEKKIEKETVKENLSFKDEKDEKITVQNKEVENKPMAKPAVKINITAANDGNGGYFKSHFDKQVKQQPLSIDKTVTTGIFKTASGWQDAKYYALIDNVEPGTIVRIVNLTNNKAIYAKVLGEVSGIRQNQGYDLRISNAAASALEVTETEKFIVRVNY